MAVVTPRLLTAMREQLAARHQLMQDGAAHVGWKLGMGDRESIDGHIVVGYLTSATRLAPGVTYRSNSIEDLHVDVEAYVELAGDGPDAIGGYGVALEIVDLTPLDDEPDSIVATNIFHRAVGFGPSAPAEPRNPEAGIRVNGELRRTNPWPQDIRERLTAAAEVLDAIGIGLRAGDRIITGSIVQVPIAAHDRIAAVIDGETAVTLEIG
jgi:2-keto-4-pentenoate hydratase